MSPRQSHFDLLYMDILFLHNVPAYGDSPRESKSCYHRRSRYSQRKIREETGPLHIHVSRELHKKRNSNYPSNFFQENYWPRVNYSLHEQCISFITMWCNKWNYRYVWCRRSCTDCNSKTKKKTTAPRKFVLRGNFRCWIKCYSWNVPNAAVSSMFMQKLVHI